MIKVLKKITITRKMRIITIIMRIITIITRIIKNNQNKNNNYVNEY